MKKQKKMRCVLRCIRIPLEIDHKINQICKDREMNYSQCVRMFISQGIKAGKSMKKTATGAMSRGMCGPGQMTRTTRHNTEITQPVTLAGCVIQITMKFSTSCA